MGKKSYLELAHEDDIKKNTGKDRDKVTYKDLAALDDQETYGKVYNDAIRKLSKVSALAICSGIRALP